MVRFAGHAKQALHLGLRQQAAEARMTEGNYFVKCNKQHFRTEGSTVAVDYEQLRIADGSAADVYFKTPRFGEGETVSIDFEKNGMSLRASGSDHVYLYIYAPHMEQGILSAPAERRDKRLRLRLPEEWAGTEVHIYGFVVDKEGRASRSTYVGVGRVNHYEERGRYIPINKEWNDFVSIAHSTEESHHAVELSDSESNPLHINLFSDMDAPPPDPHHRRR